MDAVIICVPTHLHAPIAIDAMRAKKAVFCEKPLARTLDQAEAMAQAARENDVPLQVGFVRRFDDAWLTWQDALLKDKIGRPVIWRDVASGPGPGAPWFFRDEQGAGPFLDGCIHNFDFALHTFGASGTSWMNFIWLGVGSAFTLGMMAMRARTMWFPLHPLGYLMCITYPMNRLWFSIFLGWLCKVLITRFGGGESYRRATPFFLGIILGDIVMGLLWLLIDGWQGHVGHQIMPG